MSFNEYKVVREQQGMQMESMDEEEMPGLMDPKAGSLPTFGFGDDQKRFFAQGHSSFSLSNRKFTVEKGRIDQDSRNRGKQPDEQERRVPVKEKKYAKKVTSLGLNKKRVGLTRQELTIKMRDSRIKLLKEELERISQDDVEDFRYLKSAKQDIGFLRDQLAGAIGKLESAKGVFSQGCLEVLLERFTDLGRECVFYQKINFVLWSLKEKYTIIVNESINPAKHIIDCLKCEMYKYIGILLGHRKYRKRKGFSPSKDTEIGGADGEDLKKLLCLEKESVTDYDVEIVNNGIADSIKFLAFLSEGGVQRSRAMGVFGLVELKLEGVNKRFPNYKIITLLLSQVRELKKKLFGDGFECQTNDFFEKQFQEMMKKERSAIGESTGNINEEIYEVIIDLEKELDKYRTKAEELNDTGELKTLSAEYDLLCDSSLLLGMFLGDNEKIDYIQNAIKFLNNYSQFRVNQKISGLKEKLLLIKRRL